MTNAQMATEKQIDYIIALANKISGRDAGYLSQVRDVVGLSSFQVQKLSRVKASAIIDRLQKQAG